MPQVTPITINGKQLASADAPRTLTRRTLLQYSAAAAVSTFLAGCSREAREAFFQKRFKELSAEEVKRVVARLEKEQLTSTGRTVSIGVEPPLDGVVYAYGLDLSRCIGCRRCVYACVAE